MKRALALVLAVGCNSPAVSLEADELLVNVSTQQAVQECGFLANTYPQKHVTCDGVPMVIGQEVAACSAAAGNVPTVCTATVGDFEDCVAASYDDPCGSDGDTIGKACAALDGCGTAL